MKLLYFTIEDLNNLSNGVCKKCRNQIKVFSDFGFCVTSIYSKAGYLYVSRGDAEIRLGKREKEFNRGLNHKQLISYIQENNYDYIYIRYPNTDYYFIRLLKIWKQIGSIIIVEIPTFPYGSELNVGIVKRIRLLFDVMYRSQLRKYVSFITTYSKDSKIYNIPAVQIINGVDYSEISIRKPNEQRKIIHLIAVAAMYSWHGYDRVIEGIKLYYNSQHKDIDIIFHLVGEGIETKRYKRMTKQYYLDKQVIFHGNCEGEVLDQIYNESDIGIESLGSHRKNLYLSSSLKSREYAAKGLPIITSSAIDVLPEIENEFIYRVAEDDTPIEIDKIIEFYNSLYHGKKKSQVAKSIRDRTQNVCDITSNMQKIIEHMQTR